MERLTHFDLRCELRGHEEDVRAVCVTDHGLATGSRDKTIKIWTEDGPHSFALTSTLVGHTDFVSALAYSAPGASPAFPAGALVSGSRDASVAVWDLSATAPVQRLQGHQYQVAAVVVAPSGDVVSASLDKTVRVWRGGACAAVLEGHQAAVLSLALLPGGESVASGSGDCTVRVWSLADGECTATIAAHADSVRGLAVLPGLGIVSASHDTTLKVWTLAGECAAVLKGHTAIVYCAAASPDGALVASGSEDNTAKVWRPDGVCLQTLEHPGCVWAAAFLPNGDLATACADGVARVWTQHAERAAPAGVAAAYAEGIAARAAAAAAAHEGAGGAAGALPAGVKLEDASALQAPGARDGQTKVVSEGGAGVAYSWNAVIGTWERIGEVVAGPGVGGGGGGGKWHDGREWDFVFDVDVSEGAPPLKLAMDAGDNPYLVADRFMANNDLPASYREQIVQFILQNTRTGGPAASAGQFVDPYTGAHAYVPGSAPSAATSGALHASAAGGSSSSSADPFTGGGGASVAHHIPARTAVLYTSVPAAAGIAKKVGELSAALAGEAATAELALPEADLAAGGVLSQLLARAAEPAATRAFNEADLSLLRRMLAWPTPQLFPALDLARLAVLGPANAAALAAAAGPVSAGGQPGSLGRAIHAACSAQPPVAASQQTALRLACNCAAQPAAAAWCRANAPALLAAAAGAASSGAKAQVRQGLAALLLNLAIMLGKLASEELELKAEMLSLARRLLDAAPPEDAETRFSTLLAVGTLAVEHCKVRSAARELGLLERVARLKSEAGKVGQAAAEVERQLKI